MTLVSRCFDSRVNHEVRVTITAYLEWQQELPHYVIHTKNKHVNVAQCAAWVRKSLTWNVLPTYFTISYNEVWLLLVKLIGREIVLLRISGNGFNLALKLNTPNSMNFIICGHNPKWMPHSVDKSDFATFWTWHAMEEIRVEWTFEVIDSMCNCMGTYKRSWGTFFVRQHKAIV